MSNEKEPSIEIEKVNWFIGTLKVLIRPWTNSFLRKDDLKEFMTTIQCDRIHSTTSAALDRLTNEQIHLRDQIHLEGSENRETMRLFDLKIKEGLQDMRNESGARFGELQAQIIQTIREQKK
jgi:hypothetical protein